MGSTNDLKPDSQARVTTPSFHISLPQLPAERKAQYKPVKESSLLPKIDEIIGEHEEGGVLWYFARFKGGIAHRVCRTRCVAFVTNLDAFYQPSI